MPAVAVATIPSSPPQQQKQQPAKVKFVGKHSKDGRLSIYLHDRSIHRHPNGDYDPLRVIVKAEAGFAEMALKRGEEVLVVGILGRLVCDVGLQFGEQVFLQRETAVYPPLGRRREAGDWFDWESEFVTQLPDNNHHPLTVRLQGDLPPSLCLSASRPTDSWGISYHVYAYVTSQASVKQAMTMGDEWERLKQGRRHSRVFLAWTLQPTPQVPMAMPITTTQGQVSGGGLLWARRSLQLSASLLSQTGQRLHVRAQVHNPRGMNLTGLRLSFKQVCSIRLRPTDPLHRIKTALCAQDYALDDPRAPLHDQTLSLPLTLPAEPALPYQLALRAQLPRLLSLSQPLLFPTGRFSYGGIHVQVEYYLNVHTVLPWSHDLIVRLPITIGGERVCEEESVAAPAKASVEEEDPEHELVTNPAHLP